MLMYTTDTSKVHTVYAYLQTWKEMVLLQVNKAAKQSTFNGKSDDVQAFCLETKTVYFLGKIHHLLIGPQICHFLGEVCICFGSDKPGI